MVGKWIATLGLLVGSVLPVWASDFVGDGVEAEPPPVPVLPQIDPKEAQPQPKRVLKPLIDEGPTRVPAITMGGDGPAVAVPTVPETTTPPLDVSKNTLAGKNPA